MLYGMNISENKLILSGRSVRMNVLGIIMVVVFGLIGGLSSLYCFLAIPAVLVYKAVRKAKYKVSMFD